MSAIGDVWRSTGGEIELRCGDYRDVLADVERCDAVITDPPYSERTHGSESTYTDGSDRSFLSAAYTHWDGPDIHALFGWQCAAGWVVVLTDHVLSSWCEAAARSCGRYAFAPVPVIEPGRNVRLCGDGPACWGLWLMASRPTALAKWGALPGGYVVDTRDKVLTGGKSIGLMRAIIRDYTRPGDLIVDPCAGGGTTLLAAAIEGRRAIGAEIDPKTFALAVKRLSRGYTPQFEWAEGT